MSLLAPGDARRPRRSEVLLHPPKGSNLNLAAFDDHTMSGGELPDFRVRGPWCRDVAIQEILSEGLEVGRAADARVLEQGLDFRRKHQGAATVPVVEGLLPCPVARQNQPPGTLIPERNGEHS